MDNRHTVIYRLFGVIAIVTVLLFSAACESSGGFDAKTASLVPTARPIPSATPTVTLIPLEISIPTLPPLPTTEEAIEVDEETPKPTVHPCEKKLLPIDEQYPNPQTNLDTSTGTTWMLITLDEGVLSAGDRYHYWWDTRAFSDSDSFNKGDGDCEVLLETNQIKCEGIPLRGTENLTVRGYEYDFKLYIQGYDCQSMPNYQQDGVIFLDTMEHEIFIINGKAVD